MKKIMLLALVAILLSIGLLASPMPARAATIDVDGTTCTLADAINAANFDAPSGGCTAGSGPDTLNLTGNITLSAALPLIASDITIEGNNLTINGASVERVLYVHNDGATTFGSLILNQATITGGSTAGFGGGLYNYLGSVTVNNSTINGNSSAGGGGIANDGGTMTVNNSTISGNTATGTAYGGGILNLNAGMLAVNNSTLSGNDGN
ncbi:MAG TPA: hypothetical protein DEH25_08155 [Chloroflexi bacterium]|nr:hypothetical protein [Chloroflexota bacterium]